MAEKGGFKHFMLKEVFEQPRAIKDTMLGRIGLESGRVFLDEIGISDADLQKCEQVKIVACGTSWHAGLAGKFIIETAARTSGGSGLWQRIPIPRSHHSAQYIGRCGFAIGRNGGHAGGTARGQGKRRKDASHLQRGGSMIRARRWNTTDACRSGNRRGLDESVYVADYRAGDSGYAPGAGARNLNSEQSKALVQELAQLPGKLEQILAQTSVYEPIVRALSHASDFLYLGRGIHFPIALEGALKLKEISYIHAEGYPAGEMKHGPNALIDENLPVVVLATRDPDSQESQVHYEKTLSNIQEVRARSGIVVAIACEGDEEVAKMADHLITVPHTRELLFPLLEMIPLQLLAYYIAVRRGCDVDQPRNLAKSVTVE